MVLLAIAVAGLASTVAPALATGGKLTASEVQAREQEKAGLATALLDNLGAMNTDEDQCAQVQANGQPGEKAAWTRTMNGLVDDMHQDASEWKALAVWAQGLRSRASSYRDRQDRQRVKLASGDLDIGTAAAQDALKVAARAFGEFAGFKCTDPGGYAKTARDTFDRAEQRLANGFDQLKRVVKL